MKRVFTFTTGLILAFTFFILTAPPSKAQENLLISSDSVHLIIDMNYAVELGTFRPAKDTFEMKGTMTNGWILMDSIGPGYTYKSSYYLQEQGLHFVEIRIRARDSINNADTSYVRDTIYYESVDKATRYFRVGDTTLTVNIVFENHYPGKIPMIFDCNMYYQVYSGKFSAALDYLDIVANFNSFGEQRVELFPRSIDSLYSCTIYFETGSIPTEPFTFKYRFNGDTATMELPGAPFREFSMTETNHQTTAWYNNIDPTIPATPFVSNVSMYESTISDSLVTRRIFTGIYRYEDYNLVNEGESRYQWYSADTLGGTLTPIDSAWSINYVVIDTIPTDAMANSLVGKFLVFEVIPVRVDSVEGTAGYAWSSNKIYPVGLTEREGPKATVYPNPVNELLNLEFMKNVACVEILNMTGKTVYLKTTDSNHLQVDFSRFSSGIYFVRLIDERNFSKVSKVIKY
jgi:hypothetical protein